MSARAVLTLAGSLALVGVIAIADSMTGYDVRLAILYLVPIGWATWGLGAGAGAAVSAAAAISWLVTFESSHPYSHPGFFYLEGAITVATFLIIVTLLALLRRALERSDERFLSVLEGLDAAVHVEDERSGETLYGNGRYRAAFPGSPPFARDSREIHDPASGRWYLVTSRPLRWIDDRAAMLRVFSDITEERRARELILRHREAAHRTSRLIALGEFASAVAHELNQPLAAISTYNNACLRLLQLREPDLDELREAMQKCRDQAKRAGAIIQRLREVLRHPVPARARQDINDVARAALQLAEPQALDCGVRFDLALAAGLPGVRTDRVLIEQVALNLIRNAIEAVQGLGLERRRVAIATAADAAGQVVLSVSDSGEGVPAEVRERLFEAFVTTKPGGLGLGLSICRSVIESLGGAIRHEPGDGGARFSFSLPAAET